MAHRHDLYEITEHGDMFRTYLCATCGREVHGERLPGPRCGGFVTRRDFDGLVSVYPCRLPYGHDGEHGLGETGFVRGRVMEDGSADESGGLYGREVVIDGLREDDGNATLD